MHRCPTCLTGLCVVCVRDWPVRIMRPSADSLNTVFCRPTGPLCDKSANTLFTHSANAPLSHVMLYWPMCCSHRESAGTHHASIGRCIIFIHGRCTINDSHSLLAYVLYSHGSVMLSAIALPTTMAHMMHTQPYGVG